MFIRSETLDDALLELYPKLLVAPLLSGATRGANREILGVAIQLDKPRARLSRTETRGRPFSALGELLWYLSGDNQLDFIEPFIPKYREESVDHKTVHGGYGPRLFRQRTHDQVDNVINRLRKNPATRKAVIQLFNAEDLAEGHKEIPCTTTLQFLLREQELQMIVTMRSNDAYLGLPYDVFCFTMLQEILARALGCDIGSYRQFVGSMHLYQGDDQDNSVDAARFIEEGLQSRIEMPAMPFGDPWSSIEAVQAALRRIRSGENFLASEYDVDPYWCDIIRLLQIFFVSKKNEEAIRNLRADMVSACYRHYIDQRARKAR